MPSGAAHHDRERRRRLTPELFAHRHHVGAAELAVGRSRDRAHRMLILAGCGRGPGASRRHTVAMPTDPGFTDLRTDRLVIRRFRSEDAAAFAAYRADPDVARYQSWDSYTRAMADDVRRRDGGAPSRHARRMVPVRGRRPSTDELLGDVALCVDADDTSRAELGFTMSSAEHRGRGTRPKRSGA